MKTIKVRPLGKHGKDRGSLSRQWKISSVIPVIFLGLDFHVLNSLIKWK